MTKPTTKGSTPMISLCYFSDAMSFFSKNFIPKEKSARKAFCYSSVYYATSRGKVGSNHFFGKVLIHEQVCHQTFRAPTSPPSPTSSSSSSLPSILHHFAQIINRKTRQHCGSHIYSDERKRRCEGTPKGPSYNFVLKLNITPGQGVSIFIFQRVLFIIFALNPISHLGLQRCTSFSLFLQRHRYTTAISKQKKTLKLVLPRV